MISAYWAGFFPCMSAVIRVTMYPGAMALTLTPRPAHSLDRALVSWATAPLLAA